MTGLNYTRKRARTIYGKTHVASEICDFCRQYEEHSGRIICIDEACFYVGEHGRFGYAPKGSRLNIRTTPTLRRKKYTLIMAVAREGIVKFKIMEHNCKKADFAEFVAGLNAPANSTILMDNVAFHRSECVREALRTKGFAPMYIPPYSPRMNAIENVFGAVKQEYRKHCPLAASADVNYVAIFEGVLDRWKHKPLTLFFERVSRFVAETLASGGENFTGHDV